MLASGDERQLWRDRTRLRGMSRGRQPAVQELPKELKILIARRPGIDPRAYWIEGLGWDSDGIRSDLEVSRASVGAEAAGGPSLVLPEGCRALNLDTSRPKSFLDLLALVQANEAPPGFPVALPKRLQQRSAAAAAQLPRPATMVPAPPAPPAPQLPPAEVRTPAVRGSDAFRNLAARRGGIGRAPSQLGLDNAGRPFDLKRVVVNFVNVGKNYGKKFANGQFHWEGVRRCVRHLRDEIGLRVTGVILENWKGMDGVAEPEKVEGVPNDIRVLCESIEETPRVIGQHQRSADDEMTIKCAYRRNCRMLDNDNYRDWVRNLRNEQIRSWLEHSQARVHMKYYFDSLGYFDTLDGNAERGASDEEPPKPAAAAAETAAAPLPGEPTSEEPPSPSQTPCATVGINDLCEGWPPLCAAAAQGSFDMVRGLLEKNADPNRPNVQGAFPLYFAVENWNPRMARLLLHHGADPRRATGPLGASLAACARHRLGEGPRAASRAAEHRRLLETLGVDVTDLLAEKPGASEASAAAAARVAMAPPADGAATAPEVVDLDVARPLGPARPPAATAAPRPTAAAHGPPPAAAAAARRPRPAHHQATSRSLSAAASEAASAVRPPSTRSLHPAIGGAPRPHTPGRALGAGTAVPRLPPSQQPAATCAAAVGPPAKRNRAAATIDPVVLLEVDDEEDNDSGWAAHPVPGTGEEEPSPVAGSDGKWPWPAEQDPYM